MQAGGHSITDTRDGPSARARRSDLTRLGSDRRNPDKRCGKDGPFAPEARNISLHNFTDQPGSVVLIGVTIPGLGGLGKIALPFIHRPFHSAASTHGEQEDNAA